MAVAKRKRAKGAAQTFGRAAETIAEMPRFEAGRTEFPAVYREFAEQGLAQAKQTYDRVKAAAEETNEMLEASYASAAQGASEYGVRMMEALRANINANFDFARELFAVKSPSQLIELSSSHARKQFEAVSLQSKDLASLAQKLSNEAAAPFKAGMNKVLGA